MSEQTQQNLLNPHAMWVLFSRNTTRALSEQRALKNLQYSLSKLNCEATDWNWILWTASKIFLSIISCHQIGEYLWMMISSTSPKLKKNVLHYTTSLDDNGPPSAIHTISFYSSRVHLVLYILYHSIAHGNESLVVRKTH